jgi:flagellar motility protein MotE (MotC chaperone)
VPPPDTERLLQVESTRLTARVAVLEAELREARGVSTRSATASALRVAVLESETREARESSARSAARVAALEAEVRATLKSGINYTRLHSVLAGK